MINFGNTLSILEEALVQEQVRYQGNNHIFQEAKKSKQRDDGEAEISEKYDDKYDLDDDQGSTIEPVEIDLDEDEDTDDKTQDEDDDEKDETSDAVEDDEESDDEEEKEDEEKSKKKKSKKKKHKKTDKDDDDKKEKEESVLEAVFPKKNPHQDIDKAVETRVTENNYYSAIANSSKDLEHLYKTLLRRGDRDAILEELTNLYEGLKELRMKYFATQSSGKVNSSDHKNKTYQGMQRIIDQDTRQIDQNLELIRNGDHKKVPKNLVKKTVKLINNLQQDMVTECERSQPAVIRGVRDIAKKLWLFESYTEDDDCEEVITESGVITIVKKQDDDNAIFAKIGELLLKMRKQQALQDLAEKNGVQINGMRYTDDTIMNIATSVVALMLAQQEGDIRYRSLVEQGTKKRTLKAEIINAYKDKANALINRYHDQGITSTIVSVTDDRNTDDVQVVTDENTPEVVDEYYVDPDTGEMKWIYEEAETGQTTANKASYKKIEKGETVRWKVVPNEKVEDIKFGKSRKETQDALKHDFGTPKKSTAEEDDYGPFKISYENDQVATVTIFNTIEVELDRSIVFPGNTDNIKKKALDMTLNNGELVSTIMSITVTTNSDNTIKSITFARKHYYSDQKFEKFDAIKQQVANGKDEDDAIDQLEEVYKFLKKHELLSPTGKSEMKHLDHNAILTSNEVNEKGKQFLHQYYDKCKDCDKKTIYDTLERYYQQFDGQIDTKGE